MNKKTILTLAFCASAILCHAQNQTVTHVVQRGETIESIAETYGVSADDIAKANPNMDGMFYVGMKLNVPNKASLTTHDDSQTTPTIPSVDIARHSTTQVGKRTNENNTNDTEVWKFTPAFEIGFGFIKGADNFMYEATAGINYNLPYNIYAGARIGYNSCNYNSLTTIDGTSVNSKTECHLIEIPLEVGYKILTDNHNFGIIPFAGIAANVGISGKSKYRVIGSGNKWNSQKIKIGGKVGLDAKVGIRLRIMEFNLSGSYHFSLNDKQKVWFGKDAYPEITIGWGF